VYLNSRPRHRSGDELDFKSQGYRSIGYCLGMLGHKTLKYFIHVKDRYGRPTLTKTWVKKNGSVICYADLAAAGVPLDSVLHPR